MSDLANIISGLKDGSIVPYLGQGALEGSVNTTSGEPIPADSDSLIYAMNGGKPMAPKLMYEFPRAAMNQELKRGRNFLTRFLNDLYGPDVWTTPALYSWLIEQKLPYVIDINRDTLLQAGYASRPHYLIQGVARITATDYRFKIFHFDGEKYTECKEDQELSDLPLLFKPMGSPIPEANYIASDADYVDYITELMGGFAIPKSLKEIRKDKQYLFIGLRFNRDTERMVMSDIVFSSGSPTGWALIPEPNDKEKRFCARQGIEIIEAGLPELLEALGLSESVAA